MLFVLWLVILFMLWLLYYTIKRLQEQYTFVYDTYICMLKIRLRQTQHLLFLLESVVVFLTQCFFYCTHGNYVYVCLVVTYYLKQQFKATQHGAGSKCTISIYTKYSQSINNYFYRLINRHKKSTFNKVVNML